MWQATAARSAPPSAEGIKFAATIIQAFWENPAIAPRTSPQINVR